VGLYQFTHAQMQETLISELPLTRRVRMHARIAEALEEHYGDEAEEHAAELVEHFIQAETVLGHEKVVRYALAAGLQALSGYGFESAVRHFTRGLEFHPLRDRTAAQLNLGLARALSNTLSRREMQRACAALVEAFDIHQKVGAHSADLIRTLTNFPLLSVQGVKGVADLYRSALNIADRDTTDYLDLLIGKGHWARYELYDERLAEEASSRAIELAQAQSDDIRLLRALLVKYQGPSPITDDPSVAEQIEILVDKVDDPVAGRLACEFLAKFRINSGELTDARRWAERALEIARASRNHWEISVSIADFVHVLLIAGALEEALAIVKDGLNHFQEEIRIIGAAISANSLIGNIDDTRKLIDIIAQAYPSGTPVKLIYGPWNSIVASWIHGMNLIDRRALDRSIEFESTDPRLPEDTRYLWRLWLAWAGIIEDDRSAVEARYCQIRDSISIPSEMPNGSWIGAHAPALVAAYLGHNPEADEYFQRAMSRAIKVGSPTLKAMVAGDYAKFLIDRNARGDHEKAIELQDEAISIARVLGMKPLLERVLAKREILRA
jgi:tetratricopeptide (TPR) repeat protein